ncbi:MAG: DNA mismatch repair endonuclease MutL [Ruminococcaceae bacterium]|nr:DNA mismatch repair endonuclease MutL [Oscillospiraceae bacterium]
MAEIKVLPKHIAELIAAGEVVERPSAVIKELVENSIDAGATDITVDIKRGGILYMSVRDNGSGIAAADVPTAFMRHATSKINKAEDLDAISTLGFRGEALAAISSVSKTEIITRTAEEAVGTRCVIEGGVQTALEEVGCDTGTLIVVRDIFYNTPARMKFLKSDVTEANSIAAVIDRIALSHPEISFKLIRDGKRVLTTSGDGNLKNVVYSVLGRDFASSLIEAKGEYDGITVGGMVCKPVYCKQNRNGQFFFLNGRLIRSGTASAALEQAYKNSAMTGKFPCCVLQINVPFDAVDVNVHPSKMEVRFSDERKVFNAVYGAVKNALINGDTRPELQTKQTFNPYKPVEHTQAQQTKIEVVFKEEAGPQLPITEKVERVEKVELRSPRPQFADYGVKAEPIKEKPKVNVDIVVEEKPQAIETKTEEIIDRPIRYIGCAFDTYIIAEMGDNVYFIDKHAAHERILYEQFKETQKIEVQELLVPLTVTLTADEYCAIVGNIESLLKYGFDVDDFGNNTLVVRAIPAMLTNEDTTLILTEIAEKCMKGMDVSVERIDDIFHTVACKAAIKGGQNSTDRELEILAQRILRSHDIMYCPHGRPVAFKLTKKELEKQFGRLG